MRALAVAVAVVGLGGVACSRKARPTYEYEPWVTTTSTADAPGAPAGAPAAAGPPAAVTTTTTPPSAWRRGQRQ